MLSTVDPEGTDGSPRGDAGPVMRIMDPRTLALPDWQGNERIDSPRNIVRDDRVRLIFFVQGANTVIRINGTARLTADREFRAGFSRRGEAATHGVSDGDL